jgi:hypothetical protein
MGIKVKIVLVKYGNSVLRTSIMWGICGIAAGMAAAKY